MSDSRLPIAELLTSSVNQRDLKNEARACRLFAAMLKAVWALVLVVATASAQFVNHFEVLGVAENCSTAELSRACE